MAQQEVTGDVMKKRPIAILTGGGDILLIPEIPYDMNIIVRKHVTDGTEPVRLGGIGFVGEGLERLTDIETRTVIMGHLQRGGTPSPLDRISGTQSS